MTRGWIIATAIWAICLEGDAAAQQVASSLLDRLSIFGDGAPEEQIDDDDVRLTGAASQPQAARETSRQRSASKPRSSFMSRFSIPKLLPKSSNDEQDTSNPPLPYDPAELRSAPSTGKQPPSNRAASARMQGSRSAPANRPTQRQAADRRSAAAPPREVRSSPTTGERRNELAEALAGLSSAKSSTPASGAMKDRDLATPPRAANVEELPSYLNDVAPPPQVPPDGNRYAIPQPVDVRDALLDEGTTTESENLGAIDEPAPAAEQPMARIAAPAARDDFTGAGSAKRDIAAALRPKSAPPEQPAMPPTESLGDMAAEAPSAAVKEQSKAAAETMSASPAKAAASISAGLRPNRDVLFSSRQPVIVWNIEGPQSIVVGRQAEYRVTLENKGDVAARELTAVIAAPAGAEVVDSAASNGEVERGAAAEGDAAGEIRWSLYELAAGASQTLTIQLIPRSGREMQLGVQWSHAPVGGQATVEVQEPKLQMAITGPGDVLFGKSQRYALTLSNPGNGAAEGVVIELTPPGAGEDSVVRHEVGKLAPGETKKIELELTAREAGELPIKASATATGDLRAEATKTVLCRKAELQVDWRGPEKKFAGAVATYYLRVRNPGTAAADGVAVEVNLPAGAELVEASEGHAWDADRRALSWPAAGLDAGAERFMEVQCRLSKPGVNRMELAARTTGGDLNDEKIAEVTVEALADLKLEVSDPKGVVPVGELALYEIRVQNRGQSAARGVNVVAMFSEGLEPSHVEGSQHSIRDGRVAFRTIDDLPAGGETVFRIHAKATQTGTHVFRTEVSCEELQVKLAAEETTRFFAAEERWADASTAYAEEGETTTR